TSSTRPSAARARGPRSTADSGRFLSDCSERDWCAQSLNLSLVSRSFTKPDYGYVVPRRRILGLVALLAFSFAAGNGAASTPSVMFSSAHRATQLSGEIYRLDPNGHRVELNGVPSGDSDPLVSPDG